MPAPFLHGSKPPESLATHILDLANKFSSVAALLSQQYADLNKATNGLLDGTFPWEGMAATKFFETWQNFGTYMLQLQKSCEDTYTALIKLSNTIYDIEFQQAWDVLLTIVGGIMTVFSFAAAIAEAGLNPIADGIFGAISHFTGQEGAAVTNVSEEITQADAQAATELQLIEDQLTTSPTLTGATTSTVGGDIAGGIPEADLEEMTLGASDNIPNSPTSSEPGAAPESTRGNTTPTLQYATNSSGAQQLRTANNVGNGRNIAIMDYNVDELAGSGWASSGPDFNGSIPKPTNPDFYATPTGNNPRNADSEYKLFNWLSAKLNPMHDPVSNVSGTVNLYTERIPCSSCANVIRQFETMFPNITVNVTYGP